MLAAIFGALMGLAGLNEPQLVQKYDIKPCDAQTGCKHPNFQ